MLINQIDVKSGLEFLYTGLGKVVLYTGLGLGKVVLYTGLGFALASCNDTTRMTPMPVVQPPAPVTINTDAELQSSIGTNFVDARNNVETFIASDSTSAAASQTFAVGAGNAQGTNFLANLGPEFIATPLSINPGNFSYAIVAPTGVEESVLANSITASIQVPQALLGARQVLDNLPGSSYNFDASDLPVSLTAYNTDSASLASLATSNTYALTQSSQTPTIWTGAIPVSEIRPEFSVNGVNSNTASFGVNLTRAGETKSLERALQIPRECGENEVLDSVFGCFRL